MKNVRWFPAVSPAHKRLGSALSFFFSLLLPWYPQHNPLVGGCDVFRVPPLFMVYLCAARHINTP